MQDSTGMSHIIWPEKYISVVAARWDLSRGQHPYLPKGDAMFSLNKFFKDDSERSDLSRFDLPLVACLDGHNLMVNTGYTSAAGIDCDVPISPLFVRDLAGRVIYIGYGPEKKEEADFKGDYKISFPNGCVDVDSSVVGGDLIENVFLTRFRTLDMSFDYDGTPSGRQDLGYAAYYERSNLYPYKLRPDTFYQDGWRLPQTNMLYVKQGVDISKAAAMANSLMDRWAKRPHEQSYEEFYEANNGDVWFEDLFKSGVTVVPTFEACNGVNRLNESFELEDYYPGRAIAGLHDVVERKESNLPRGTIVDVLAPGFMMSGNVTPARVVVSDGSKYVSPHEANPQPKYVDLRFPHQRTVSNWGAVWVPTHPLHFEFPAIWGWDMQTGRFLQLAGPVWDPLHYYYSSVPKILKAFRKPLDDNKYLAKVPDDMKMKFHPVIPMEGFDTISESTRSAREESGLAIMSSVDHVKNGYTSCDVGYHPLPAAFEYELDPWWFPELSPKFRLGLMEVPDDLVGKLVDVVLSTLSEDLYQAAVNAPEKATWLHNNDYLRPATGNILEDYPHFIRFFADISEFEDNSLVFDLAPMFLEHLPDRKINAPVQKSWRGADLYDDLERLKRGAYDEFFEFFESSMKLRMLRHRVFRRHPGWYAVAWWQGIPPHLLEGMIDKYGTVSREEGEKAILSASIVGAPVV